jgi:hypothetical protein
MFIPTDLLHAVPQDDERLIDLVRACLSHPSCTHLLHWLRAHPTTMMAAADFEAQLNISTADARAAIDRFDAMGLLRHVSAGNLTFYGLVHDPEVHDLVRRFEQWCDDQRERLETLRGVVR